ncbi:MAG: phosphate ABC transporter substrate-binding protein [Methanococci archaeon]|nr:phosphate ABC transporter substrate-binding protein [Methanococci archaeon]
MKKFLYGLFAILLVIGLCGCTTEQNSVSKEETLTLAGGTALIPIMEEAGKEFMKMHPNVKVEVSGGGSGFGIKEVGEGHIDIGMAGRNLNPDEKEKYPNLKVFKIGVDGVAVVVNPKNPINDLTKEQVKEIFAGKITNWKEVGGRDAPINVYTRDEESGTRETFWKLALDKGNITKKAIVVASNGEMKTKIAMDENGIGYLSVGYIDKSVKPVKLDGVAPTQENVKKGIYKIYRPLNLITNGEPKGVAKEFIDFVLSDKGQEIVKEKGFISVK